MVFLALALPAVAVADTKKLQDKISWYKQAIKHDRQVIKTHREWVPIAPSVEALVYVKVVQDYRDHIERATRLMKKAQRQLAVEHKRTSPTSLRAYAGYCLAWIIDHEGSGWNPRVWNSAGSGAYGLPQALPASKMASAGADWATNPYTQIRWMRGYTRARYGSECAARDYWISHGSY